MAKLKSFIKLEGTLDGLTFYKTMDGYLVKTKGGVSKKRIQNDPVFQRTRENNIEFGFNAKAGKFIRQSVGPMLQKGKDSRLSSRMLQLMNVIKNLDTISNRGERKVGIGLQTSEGKNLLKGFNFNIHSSLDFALQTDYTLDTNTGTFEIPELNPLASLRFPAGTTHARLSNSVVKLNFELSTFHYQYSNPIIFELSNSVIPIKLTPLEMPNMEGIQLHLLLIEFLQKVNGAYYPLLQGTYNVLTIIAVV
jgi:hypothetical protein